MRFQATSRALHRQGLLLQMSCVVWSVCVLVTCMCPALTAEPIEMLYGGLTWVRPRNHVLDGVEIHDGKEQFWGRRPSHRKALGVSTAVYTDKGIIQSSTMACKRRDHLICNNGTTCNAAFCQNSLTSCCNVEKTAC